MKTIADTQPTILPSAGVVLDIDVRATLMRRVLPLGLALATWAAMIEGARLIF